MKNLLRLLVLAMNLTALNASAQTQPIVLRSETPPLVLQAAGRNEPSAIEAVATGLYLIADDKVPSLALFNEKGVSVKVLKVPQDLPTYRCQKEQAWSMDVKWEAMAKDNDGYFYVIGAWAWTTARSELSFYRFKLKFDSNPSKTEIDPDSIQGFKIKNPLDRSRIEGLAIQEVAGTKRVIIGLREPPTPNGYVQLYYEDLPSKIDGCTTILEFKPLFVFNAGVVTANEKVRLHLSSIEYVPSWKGLLVVTSSEDPENSRDHKNNPFFGNKLLFFPDDSMPPFNNRASGPKQPPVIPRAMSQIFEENAKAEGLTIMGECNSVQNEKGIKVAVVYDNDYCAYPLRLPGQMQFFCLLNPAK